MNTSEFVRGFFVAALIVAAAFMTVPAAIAGGDIFDGYIQIDGTWYNIGGVNDGRNNPNGSANQSTRTLLSNVDFGTQTFGNFNLTGFQIYGWTTTGTSVANNGANYKVWNSGSAEPGYSNFWDTSGESYYSGGDYTASATGQSTGLIGATFINGDTYNLKIQTYTVLTGDNAGSKWFERSDSFVVDGARQLITGSGNSTQAAAYNTSSGGGVVKQGTGSLTLAFDSSNVSTGQKGDIYIDEGAVAVNPNSGVSGDNALGGANTTIRLGAEGGGPNAKLALTDSDGGLTISRNIVVRAGSSGTKTVAAENSQGTNTYSGVMYLNDDVTLSAASGATLDISGQLDDGADVGGDDVFVGGAGTVLFSGSANNQNIVSYTVLSGAKLLLAKSSADAIQSVLTINSGGTAELAASDQFGSGVDIFNNGILATGSGGFTDSFDVLESSGNITGNGTLTASSYALSGGGTVSANLGGGTINITGNATLNGSSGANIVAITGGNLTLGSGANRLSSSADVTISLNRSLSIASDQTLASVKETGNNNGGTVSIGGGATLTINGANKGNLFQNTISGDGNLTVAASGTTSLSLYGTQSYTGATTVSGGKLSTGVALASSGVTVSGGTFEATAADILGDSAGVTVNSGTYTVGGSDTIGALTGSGGSVNITNGTLTATYASGASTYAGDVTGSGAFAKAGGGKLTLSGNNSKSGVNTVSAGTLKVASAGSLSGATTVQSGATLDVDGTLSGTVAVDSGGTLKGGGSVGTLTINGILAPGNSAGTLTATNGASWVQGGSYDWEIFDLDGPAGAGWDLLSVSAGTLNLTGITASNGFMINLVTLGTNNSTPGALDGFLSTATYTNWMIASAPTISGFAIASNYFTLNSASFVGAAGTFGIEQRSITGGEGLFITYTGGGGAPVPEPSTWAAAALLACAAAYVRLRRRKGQSDA